MLKSAIASLCLVSSVAFADTPNIFAPNEWSSEAIVTGVLSCVESLNKQIASGKAANIPNMTKHFYCGCAIDATRAKKATMPNLQKCMDSALKRK